LEKVIVIGGGVSGLSCAYNLVKKGYKDFLLITPEIGGRVLESRVGHDQYGAFYVSEDYHHMKRFVHKKREMKREFFSAFKNKKKVGIRSKEFYYRPIELVRFYVILNRFRKRYEAYKVRCERMEQAESLKKDKWLSYLYRTRAGKFVKDNGLDYLSYYFLSEGVYATTFSSMWEIPAFTFLQFSLPFVNRFYEFYLDKDKFVKPIEKQIVYDRIESIERKLDHFVLRGAKKDYACRVVVVATEPIVAKRLLKMKSVGDPVEAYMYHLSGEIREGYESYENVFSTKSRYIVISKQADGTYLFYAKQKISNFDRFFRSYKIILEKHWNPAFNLRRFEMVRNNYAKNIYLIGDHNVSGMEDSYITGLYAARQIMKGQRSGTKMRTNTYLKEKEK
jgi:hypothetical protein